MSILCVHAEWTKCGEAFVRYVCAQCMLPVPCCIDTAQYFANLHAARAFSMSSPVNLMSPLLMSRKDKPAYAIVASGGYKDDKDEGEVLDYTGEGGVKGKQHVSRTQAHCVILTWQSLSLQTFDRAQATSLVCTCGLCLMRCVAMPDHVPHGVLLVTLNIIKTEALHVI